MGIVRFGLLAAGGCLLRSEYEKGQLRICRYTIEHEKIPDSFDGVRILLLADLHNKSFGRENEMLYTYVKAIHPDYILSSGDMIIKTKPDSTKEIARFLGRLTAICPVYCGNGNHELELKKRWLAGGVNAYDSYTRLLKKYGVKVLSNATAVLTRGSEAINVSGLDLGLGYYAKGFHVPMREGYIRERLGEPDPGRFHILLGHYPNYFPEYAAWGADLTLAGHMHGGTVRLPGAGGLMSPNYEFFPAYDKGLYERKGSFMVVSPGLGTHSVNIRFGGNYPELSVIVLKKKRGTYGNRG